VKKVRSAARAGGVLARDPRTEFNDEEWHDMVSTAAYHLAEARGFEGGSPDEDWYEAEAQLREQLAAAQDEAEQRAEAGLDLKAHRHQESV
jgi:hypothetical protein